MAVATDLVEKLFISAMEDKSIKEILDFAYDILHNPLIVFGDNANVACYSFKDDLSKQIPAAMSINGDDTQREQFFAKMHDEFYSFPQSVGPRIVADGICFPGIRRIVMCLSTENNHLGAIALFEVNNTFSEDDLAYVETIGKALSVKLLQLDTSLLRFEQNIQDLLCGNKLNISGNEWLMHVNGHKYQNFILASLDVTGIKHKKREEMKQAVSGKLYFSSTVTCGNHLVVLANPRNKSESAVLRDILTAIMHRYHVNIGCSNTFSNILDLQLYYQQAVDARTFGCMTDSIRQLHEFSDHAMKIMLWQMTEHVNLTMYISNKLEELSCYDKANQTDYYKTLITFIRFGKNRRYTCDRLNIHKNTLSYRLEKLEELTGHSMDDGDFLFNLYLSSQIKEVIALRNKS